MEKFGLLEYPPKESLSKKVLSNVNTLFLQVLSAVIGLILVLIVYREQVRYVFGFAIEELKRLKNII